MPTYEYECQTCGKTFEVFQNISEDSLEACPPEMCKKQGTVKRLISGGSGLLFKGSGFYLTDYRSESYKAGAKADKSSAPGSSDAAASKKKTSAKKEKSS